MCAWTGPSLLSPPRVWIGAAMLLLKIKLSYCSVSEFLFIHFTSLHREREARSLTSYPFAGMPGVWVPFL